MQVIIKFADFVNFADAVSQTHAHSEGYKSCLYRQPHRKLALIEKINVFCDDWSFPLT